MDSETITFQVSPEIEPKVLKVKPNDVKKFERVLLSEMGDKDKNGKIVRSCDEMLQSSDFAARRHIRWHKNGLVNTVVEAYNHHINLTLRPDDLWMSIMVLFSEYINDNSEKFREKFVDFDGKKELVIEMEGSLRNCRYDDFINLMTKMIDANIVDPDLKNWIIPNFSTTSSDDRIVFGALLMGTLKNYFTYEVIFLCGIPSITLLGTLLDWENLKKRLGKLREYGLDIWTGKLEKIVEEFIRAKKGEVNLDFWHKMVKIEYRGSGNTGKQISGWLVEFCGINKFLEEGLCCSLKNIPSGVVHVPVKINDLGAKYDATLMAGQLGQEVILENNSIRPVCGWALGLLKEKDPSRELQSSESSDEN